MLAHALLATVDYALTRSVRTAWVEAAARTGEMLPRGFPEREVWTAHATYWWLARVSFDVFELGSFAVAAIALTRQRTKAYFDAVARAAESAEEP